MHLSEFNYELPEELIAQRPMDDRSASRLLCIDRHSGVLLHTQFLNLLDQLRDTDLLVFNDTRVIPARMWAYRKTGGKIEILIERLLSNTRALVHLRFSHEPKAEEVMALEDSEDSVIVEERRGACFVLRTPEGVLWFELMARHGHMPLPPYITRDDDSLDYERYQTVYADKPGAVAAPTAGLHFDEKTLSSLRARGVDTGTVTLHIGAGTFQPVRCEIIEDHPIHHEWLQVSQTLCDQVAAARARGGRVVAVGTTSVRALESACSEGVVQPFEGDTNLFIYPGYRFQVVDAILTNFHLPESSLLMLVSAFAGMDLMREAYRQAVEQKYRFFSYGDAMFIA